MYVYGLQVVKVQCANPVYGRSCQSWVAVFVVMCVLTVSDVVIVTILSLLGTKLELSEERRARRCAPVDTESYILHVCPLAYPVFFSSTSAACAMFFRCCVYVSYEVPNKWTHSWVCHLPLP